jgi:hypothetical protein
MNTTSPRDPDGVPDLILEQYRLGELSREDAARVTALLSADDELRARHERLDRSDQAIAQQYPPGWLAQRVRARIAGASDRRVGWRLPLAIAASAAVLIFAAPYLRRGPAVLAPGVTDDRIKGLAPGLTIYRRTASGTETLADGGVARQGDLLRVAYTGAGRSFGIILSIDGRGVVTRHFPADGDRAVALARGSVILLDQAYELDDAPGWERFYFVTGDTAFALAPIVDAAHKIATGGAGAAATPLPIPRGLSQSTFSLQKEVRR